MSSYHHYNNKLNKFSRRLRNRSTKAEVRIWAEILKAKKMKGYTFNRQRPIDRYIVDFFSAKLKLIIEIDGWTHEGEDQKDRDEVRQEHLESLGYFFLRFTGKHSMNYIFPA